MQQGSAVFVQLSFCGSQHGHLVTLSLAGASASDLRVVRARQSSFLTVRTSRSCAVTPEQVGISRLPDMLTSRKCVLELPASAEVTRQHCFFRLSILTRLV